MNQYCASVAEDGSVKPEIRSFYERFYQISDTPEAHEEYSQQFTKDGKLIMASTEANGREGILKTRMGMWEKVAKRSHKPHRIYAFSPGSDDVMIYGTVDYELKDGRKTTVDWAARSHFVHEDGALRMDFYQVYLDTSAMMRAK